MTRLSMSLRRSAGRLSTRWRRSILLSVISMLASPNDESAANLDAAKEWRDTPDVFKRKVREAVRRAQEDWG